MARKKRSDGAPSLRSPELESAIRAAPEDVDPYLVYADWLERQGDPRGGWIARHVDLIRDPSSPERLAALEVWLAAHRAAVLPNIGGEDGSGAFRWRHGFLRVARVHRMSKSPSLAERTRRLFHHPSAAFLEGLILGFPVYKDADPGLDEVVRELAHAPETLTHLYVAETVSSLPMGELSPVFQSLPRLRRLVLNGEVELGESRRSGRPRRRHRLSRLREVASARLARRDHRRRGAPPFIPRGRPPGGGPHRRFVAVVELSRTRRFTLRRSQRCVGSSLRRDVA
jgi:uncharacterized protein (TIGR02996 family)